MIMPKTTLLLADHPPGQLDTVLRARNSDTHVDGSFLTLKATQRNASETIKRVGPFSLKQSTRVSSGPHFRRLINYFKSSDEPRIHIGHLTWSK